MFFFQFPPCIPCNLLLLFLSLFPIFVLPGGEIRISHPQKQSGTLLKHNWDLPEALTWMMVVFGLF